MATKQTRPAGNAAQRQSQPRSLEARRAERRRRERRRKKRIRALILLILLIAVIVLVIIAFVSCSRRGGEDVQPDAADQTDVSPMPTDGALPADGAVPTGGVPSDTAASTSLAGLPPAEQENNLLTIIENLDAQGAEKTCYLTFDDGPSENVTPSILDTLRRYNVKATFFMLGTSIDTYSDLARRVYEEGHLLANHSHGHNYETLYATEESFMSEVQETEDSIEKVTNGDHNFKLFRFPGGSYNAGDHASEKQVYKNTLALNGFYYIDWNALNGDAEGRTKNASELLEYLQSNLDTDSSAVVLMHDAAAKTATAEGLSSIIEYLMSEGYVFKRLDEMPYVPPAQTVTSSNGGTYADGGSYDTQSGSYSDGGDDTDESGYGASGSGSGTSGGYNSSYDSDDGDDTGSGLSGDGSILSTPAAGSTTRTSVNGVSVNDSSIGGSSSGDYSSGSSSGGGSSNSSSGGNSGYYN